MTDMIPRLRSIRFKDGRATLRVIRPLERSDQHDDFVASAKDIADHQRGNMAGYVIVAWSKNGGTSVGVRSTGEPIPIMMIPEFVKTCVADWVHSKGSE